MYNPCFLLTATIAPKGMIFTRRTNPRQREADYVGAIRQLAGQTKYPIVFAENSGVDLSTIKKTLSNCAPTNHEIVDASRGFIYPPEKGKGYSELLIIRYALEHSAVVKNASHFIKLTGRYHIVNLAAVMDSLESAGDFFIASAFQKDERYTWSVFFVCQPAFITDYLAPLQETLDDKNGRSFELAFHEAIERAISDGKNCLTFPVRPIAEGYSGTWNAKVKKDNYFDVEISVAKIIIVVRRYIKAIKRRLKLLFTKP